MSSNEMEKQKRKNMPPPAPLGNKYAVGHDGSNAGRPIKQINLDLLANLASIQCTDEEIASILDISVDTLTSKYSDVLKKNRDTGKASLRRTQWKMAKEGSAAAAIWLGKVYLKQKEHIEENAGPTTVIINKIDK